ncbi:MAG: 4-hydroxy-tetrahydrodipicolinate reductase [Proteobacteria bacterium]|nr:4-hydroxy-tetrahydrodipicolinate reductase [Pseudomonadota bacterium]
MTRVDLALHGAAGRMGRAVLALLTSSGTGLAARGVGGAAELCLVAALERRGHPGLGEDVGELVRAPRLLGVRLEDSLESALGQAARPVRLVVDFSGASEFERLCEGCQEHGLGLVSGTTGLDAAGLAAADRLAESAPVLLAPNFSLGINALLHLADRASRMLGTEFDAEIVEMHHRRKVDAPSGTAVSLADVVARAHGLEPATDIVHGRSGEPGPRPSNQLGVLALRGGDVVGEHTLLLAGSGERLELTHRAHDRAIFARGALRASAWLASQPPGRYCMADVLGVAADGGSSAWHEP